jgi:CheY-like chemotaxis protein
LLPQLFDLFVQGNRSLDRSQGGLGIGLTLVQRLVELHHGRVEAHSDGAGTGAAFKIVLPCIDAVVEASPPPPAGDSGPPGYARRVLVVDDNVDAAASLAMFLRLEGHDVGVASDGWQALASASTLAPQVVILDIGLPGLSGHEVARRLREQPDQAQALLIALTGYGQKEDRVKAIEAGFDHLFVKPADPREIHRVICNHHRPGDGSLSDEQRGARSAR